MNYIEQFMKDNNIKVNEEFYIADGKSILGGTNKIRFYFNENLFLEEKLNKNNSIYILNRLLKGEWKVKKIPPKPKSIYDLKDEDVFYYVGIAGEIKESRYHKESFVDKELLAIGNAFLTKEEAKFELERRKCEAILLKYGTRDATSLGNNNTSKFYIIYNNFSKEIMVCSNCFIYKEGIIYFESEELARSVIKECGEDRLKKYIFNIKE